MSSETLYENIFEAFKVIAPTSPLLQLQGNNPAFFTRSSQYEIIDMGGYYAAFPGGGPSLFRTLYRGERKKRDTCKASIYRSGNPDDVIIDELRCIEFKNILLTFPQVEYAIEDKMKVDFLALAQHYDLNTRLIDVSSEPEIAAYFATQQWVNGVPTPVGEGIGCIRGLPPPINPLEDSKYHMIGLQCFQRPGLQAAYGIELGSDEDLHKIGWRVYFKQNADISRIIHFNFHIDLEKVNQLRKAGMTGAIDAKNVETDHGWLFPHEEIADVAMAVKNCLTVSKKTVEEYGKPCAEVLSRNGISIVEEMVYTLSEQHCKELKAKYKDRPYGDVQLNSRLCFIPGGNKSDSNNSDSK